MIYTRQKLNTYLLITVICLFGHTVYSMEELKIQKHINCSRLIKACKEGNIEQVKALATTNNINHLSSYNKTPLCNKTPLWIAILSGTSKNKENNYKNYLVIKDNYLPIVKLLLQAKADTETKYQHETPLSYATRTKNWDLVKLLAAHKADVNKPDEWGRMPLHWAIRHKEYDIITLLLEKDTNTKNMFKPVLNLPYEETPLYYAARTNDIELLELLLKYRPKELDCENRYCSTKDCIDKPKMEKLLKKYGVIIKNHRKE